MNVVLVLPPYDYSGSVGNTRKKVQIGLLPPLGVGYLASALEARGHSVALVDAIAEQLDVPETARAVAALRPEVVGISSYTTLTPNDAYALAKTLKEQCPEVPIVMGGPHVTAFARTILDECPCVDLLIPGDGEVVLCEVVDRFAQRQPFHDVRGILYRDSTGTIVETPPPEPVRDIDRFPHPARRIYKHELYCPLPSLSARRPVTSMITSRGCPWARCTFCYNAGEFRAPYRRRSPANVVDEMARLSKERGIRNVVFWDDHFCATEKWVGAFCDELDKARLGMIWSVISRVNTVTPAMLKRMAASGCYSIQYGIESGCQEILDLVRKGHTLDQCRDAVRWAKEAGLDTRAFFILGFPTETPEMAEQTLRFACELNIDYVVFFSYHVWPGTDLASLAMSVGYCGEYEGQHLPSYVPNTYPDAEALRATVKAAYRRYYFRPRYMARALARLVRKPSLIKNHVLGFYYWLGLMLAK